jgi:hypothetical protein
VTEVTTDPADVTIKPRPVTTATAREGVHSVIDQRHTRIVISWPDHPDECTDDECKHTGDGCDWFTVRDAPAGPHQTGRDVTWRHPFTEVPALGRRQWGIGAELVREGLNGR